MAESLIDSRLLAVAIVFPILSTAFIGLRFWAHKLHKQDLHSSDWVILAAAVFAWVTSCMVFWAADQAGVNTLKPDVPITRAIYVFAATQWIGAGMILGISLALVKIAVLLFYRRIFIQMAFQILVWVTIALCAIWGLSTVIVQILTTVPVSGVLHNVQPVYRYDYPAFSISVAANSLILDVLILFYPLPLLRNLQMPLRKKLAIAGIFSLGAVVVIAGAARLGYLVEGINATIEASKNGNGTSVDPYTSTRNFFIWALIEPNASIIAACLPTLAPLRESALGSAVSSSFRRFTSSLRSSQSGDASKTSKGSSRERPFKRLHQDSSSMSNLRDLDSSDDAKVVRMTTVDVELGPISNADRARAAEARDF